MDLIQFILFPQIQVLRRRGAPGAGVPAHARGGVPRPEAGERSTTLNAQRCKRQGQRSPHAGTNRYYAQLGMRNQQD
jgi:hypothetical protein